jgi:hypothetical protein
MNDVGVYKNNVYFSLTDAEADPTHVTMTVTKADGTQYD